MRWIFLLIFSFSALVAFGQVEEVPSASPRPGAGSVKPQVVRPQGNRSVRGAQQMSTTPQPTNSARGATPGKGGAPAGTIPGAETGEKEKKGLWRIMGIAADKIVMTSLAIAATAILIVPTAYAASTIFN